MILFLDIYLYLDVVRSTGNLSSFIYLFYLFKCIFYSLQYIIPDLI